MAVTGVSPSVNMLHASLQGARGSALPDSQQANGPSFANRLGQALENVNAQQAKATQAVRDFDPPFYL
jgi:flagellar hook-basal body complex protein FliE